MAKLYGNRWRTIDQLGTGGQSEVFRVKDETGEFPDPCALKRVRNPKRHARFVAEVSAIKSLRHLNIIQLLDHSALESDGDERQFLVMPLAHGGSLEKRVGMYRNSLDSVLIAGQQLAGALQTAHDKGVIHRDVKPQNILFASDENAPLLADFGICLVRDAVRATATDEVVGPWSFMAPELEGGGRLDVTPKADVYSLGKVLFFMLSGGTVIPREHLHRFASFFPAGERNQLMYMLLSKMLAPVESRLLMSDVAKELARIVEWEKRAHATRMTPAAASMISRLKAQETELQRIQGLNLAARKAEQQKLELVARSTLDWLRTEVDAIADVTNSPGIFECSVQVLNASQVENFAMGHDHLVVHGCVELVVKRPGQTFDKEHGLMFLLGSKTRIIVRFGSDVSREEPEQDLELVFLPYYRKHEQNRSSQHSWEGFLVRQTDGPRRHLKDPKVVRTFHGDDVNLAATYRLSEWPTATERLGALLGEAIEVFIGYLEQGASGLGR